MLQPIQHILSQQRIILASGSPRRRQILENVKRVDLIIGADTVVTMDGQIYEKPKDDEDAFRMLSRFSGRSHTVYTGVVIARPMKDGDGFDIVDFHEGTDVDFAKISPEVIRGYIKTGEPMDKDGGYGIQAKGGTLIERVNGDYFNVMGFPLHRFSRKLLDMYGDHLHWQT